MAINAQQLLSSFTDSTLTQAEQICINYLEGSFDKEILKQFTGKGSTISLRLQTYFLDVLLSMNINKGRNQTILNVLISIYDEAGWKLVVSTTPLYDILQFTIKQ